MKERKLNKVYVAMNWFKGGRYLARTLGALLLLMIIAIIAKGVQRSDKDAMMVEALNMMYAGESDLYPVEGVTYELEARVITDDGNSMWYHNAISANIGDLVEVRLKAIAANPSDANRAIIEEYLSMNFSKGLSPISVQELPKSMIRPNGTVTDYRDNPDDEHIAYIAFGVYEVTSKDWLSGKSASGFQAHVNGETVSNLTVIWPFCEVDIRLAIFLFIGAAICGLALPFAITLIEPKVIGYLEDMD